LNENLSGFRRNTGSAMNPMISVGSYELNHRRVECLYDQIDWLWYIIHRGHTTCDGSFPEASEKMDEAIKEINE
jgi:hypothetical protein